MAYKTRAIVGYGPKQAPVISEVVLDDMRPDEAIVEIHAVGICHADVAVLQGVIPLPFPRVLGHEGESPIRYRERFIAYPHSQASLCLWHRR
jgi:Zn-dependent alcohol dehydrogenase